MKTRLTRLDWRGIERSLWQWGYAKTPPVLSPSECAELIGLYADERRSRSTIDMARYKFGVGEYRYFAAPLPPLVEALRRHAYPPLAAIANRWEAALSGSVSRLASDGGAPAPRRPAARTSVVHPARLDGLLALCRRRGQTKPTPLLLHYETGGYNCLHQDLYGDVVFPLQLTCFLSRRGGDYTGGDFLLVEQRPRAPARGAAVAPGQGEIVIFATRHPPGGGARGGFRGALRPRGGRAPPGAPGSARLLLPR